ncbi:MAG: hydroxymethylglutaryl-CoA reductase, degradative [Cryomorphaceae bacterium]|nr:hydroxymethylglutaryl-CoA reductase, degradative [Cryomorphaceae bacterium]MBT3504086.1 hydroxymethylglutaryl-CoA reductase, degradative [Cryomorphaceae bacterium]MBT3688542.1 hydroxymethylglutaryl-CoA reductase, degradative [Cryomorphaceae bacterium]MBT4222409.1 hydroxymethylglutaryl-CoA reductase, degradative [Cryomorphaceae bacterium]MBT4293950.1 hydroxymethylglutaryl-CoA reductase, degradative [Cryomorphaceae bacterium]
MMPEKIIGFSKLSREDKISWISSNFLNESSEFKKILNSYLNNDTEIQSLHNSFSENSISNFYLPYSVSPNFLINNKNYCIPLVTEESSVVAALSNSSKFWFERGGFKSNIINNLKNGQIHFMFKGKKKLLEKLINDNVLDLIKSTDEITKRMRARGGGIKKIKLIDKSSDLKDYLQLSVDFITVDSMGANFINSCLEKISKTFKELIIKSNYFKDSEKDIKIIMSILSNYTPDCLVEASVECNLDELGTIEGLPSREFASKFKSAFDIAQIDINRAVTHNKGIMNGIDAVLISTGNDFRAVEAGIHAYASSDGYYKSLSQCSIINDNFKISLKIPVSVGTVGGITDLHPMVKLSLQMLGNPTSLDLMKIICSVGLAQNFAAVKSLVSSGIQKGHMKMHLINLLIKNSANKTQIENSKEYFKDKEINNQSVIEFLNLKNLK